MSDRERARRRRFHLFMAEYYAARQADLLALEAATALYVERTIPLGPVEVPVTDSEASS